MNLKVVLVGSKYPRNIGMAARVLSNYALKDLILVSPQCDPHAFEVRQGAAEGQEPLAHLKVYKTWEEFYASEQEGPRIAFSRREGKKRQSTTIPQLLKMDIIDQSLPCYLIFGSEDKGLSNQDLKLVHRLCHFELPGTTKSMNLSHAVLFAIKSFYDFDTTAPSVTEVSSPIFDPEKTLRMWLECLDIDLDTHTKVNALTVIQQMILKSSPTSKELHILDSLIQQTVRRLEQRKTDNHGSTLPSS